MHMRRENGRPRVGIFGLTGCAGDQLVILNCEDELSSLFSELDIRDFLMASSGNDEECQLDIAFVEGAVLSRRDEERLRRIRDRAQTLVAIGTCAVCGGIAAMDRDFDRRQLIMDIYGEPGRELDTSPARALREIVEVDVNVSGCPIEKSELLAAVTSLLNGDRPLVPEYPVCAECKMLEHTCLLVERAEVCLGPLTQGGCAARCPGLGIACVGCRGPANDANTESAMALFEELGISSNDVGRKLRTFSPVVLDSVKGRVEVER